VPEADLEGRDAARLGPGPDGGRQEQELGLGLFWVSLCVVSELVVVEECVQIYFNFNF
jgi:hypothetical protein